MLQTQPRPDFFPPPRPDVPLSAVALTSDVSPRYDLPSERADGILKAAGLPEDTVGRLVAEIEAAGKTPAFAKFNGSCPAGRRLGKLECPPDGTPKELFEMVGSAVFYLTLLRHDRALAHELETFFSADKPSFEGINPREFAKRIETFLTTQSRQDLACAPALLASEHAGENDLAKTYFLRGLLSPYFKSAQAAEPSKFPLRELATLINLFHIPPAQLGSVTDSRLTRHDVKVLRSLFDCDVIATNVEPRIRWALDKLDGVQSLDALMEVLNSVDRISVPDLGYILRKLPRGRDWGINKRDAEGDRFVSELRAANCRIEGIGHDLCRDILIINRAFDLCDGTGDASGASRFGRNMRQIVGSTRTSQADYTSSFRPDLHNFLEAKLKKVFGKMAAGMAGAERG